ncbi:hypothetical protein CU097_003672, partial [Rhizopus azygosporus]
MNNNTVTTLTTNCSSCRAPLPIDSAYRTCQTCREQVAATRRRRRAEQEEQEGSPQGSVQLQLLPDPPEYLKNLLASTDTQGRHFKDSLRQYNTTFAFTSLGCDIVSAEGRNANNNRGGLNSFQIHDALCHSQGSLLPVEDKNIRTILKAAKEDTSAPGPSNVVINEKTSMPIANKNTSVQAVLTAPTPSISQKNKTTTNEQKQIRCPSCGGADHSRSSSKLCPMNKAKTKPLKPKDTVEKTFVIKTSLANTCKYPKFITLVQEVVDHITQLVYDGSIFTNYYFLGLLENGEELPTITQNLFYNIFCIFAGQGKHASDSIKKSFKTFCESTSLIQSDLNNYVHRKLQELSFVKKLNTNKYRQLKEYTLAAINSNKALETTSKPNSIDKKDIDAVQTFIKTVQASIQYKTFMPLKYTDPRGSRYFSLLPLLTKQCDNKIKPGQKNNNDLTL